MVLRISTIGYKYENSFQQRMGFSLLTMLMPAIYLLSMQPRAL